MANIDDLVDQHGEETVRKAFWLQEQIYEEGIEAARNSNKKGKQLIEVYQNHKEFVEAYLELHYPSETVVKIIKDEPELSELESYL